MTRTLVSRAAALCAAAGLASPLALGEAPEGDFAAVLPNGTMLYAYVDSVQRALDVDPDGDLRRLLEHEAVKQAFSRAYEILGFLEDEEVLLGLDLEEKELARLLSGRLAVAVPEISLVESELESVGASTQVDLRLDAPRGVVVLADFAGTRDRLEELLANVARLIAERDGNRGAELLIDEFEGERLYAFEVESSEGEVETASWLALVGSVLLVASEEETAKSFLDLVDKGAPEGDRLLDDARYLDAVDRMGETHARAYVNLGEFLPLVNRLIRQEMAKLGTKAEPFVTADDLIEGLRLDAFQSAFVGARFADHEAGVVLGFTHHETDRGLPALFAYADSGVEIPAYFSPEFHSGSITTLDLTQLYRNIDAMVKKISPYAHTVMETFIASTEAEYGVSLREAVLGNFAPLMVEFVGYPEETQAGEEDQPTQAYVIRARDPQGLETALAEIAEFAGGEEPTEFMGERIYRIPFSGGAMLGGGKQAYLSYAVVENDLVLALGEARMVENVIAHVKDPGDSVRENSTVMAALDDLPDEDCVGLGFADIGDVLQNAIRGGEAGLFLRAGNERDPEHRSRLREAGEALDALPDVDDLHYVMVSKSYRTPESYLYRVLVRRDRDLP